MSDGLETIGGLVGGMAQGGWGLVKGAAVGGVLGAGTGALAGGAAGAVIGAPTGPGAVIAIPSGAGAGAVVGGLGGAAVGGAYGAVTGVRQGVEDGREWGRWLSEKVEGAQKKAKAKPKTDADTDCADCKPKNPCEHLKRGNGEGPYRGGGHGSPKQCTGTSSPVGDELDSHHIPSKGSYKDLDLSAEDGPAIQMLQRDHVNTSSYLNKDFVRNQARLLKAGKFDEVFTSDIANVREVAKNAGDPTRYDEAIKEMIKYKDCLDKHGITPGKKAR